jgi:hypothetical protein
VESYGWKHVAGFFALLAVLIYGGWTVYRVTQIGARDAVFEGFSTETVFLKFERYPKGDRRDVKVRISGFTLENDVELDWAYIAGHSPQRPAVDQDPPLGQVIEVYLKLPIKKRVLDPEMRDFLLRARLFWAGKKQDLIKTNLRDGYRKEK